MLRMAVTTADTYPSMMKLNRLFVALAPVAVLAVAVPAAARHAQQDAEHYLDQFIDKSANPRQDFWQYSVGNWLAEHPIPKSERQWGVGNVIQEETYQRLETLSKTAATNPGARGTNQQK